MKKLFLFLFLLFSIYTNQLSAQQDRTVTTVMFYNVENLFDTVDDPQVQDDEFLPRGTRRWTNYRLNDKLSKISKVIANTGNWEPPAVIGLCEIENRYVLERLVNHSVIRNWRYKIIHKNSPDERGIDVAAIYREDVFMPVEYRYFYPAKEMTPENLTREILYVSGVFAGLDTVHLYFNHWPSRYGGLMETRGNRIDAAEALLNDITRLQEKYLNPKIVIMGDFNDQPDDGSLARHLKAMRVEEKGKIAPDALYNLSYNWHKTGIGTLKHQTMWNVFDQIIISGNLFQKENSLFTQPEDAYILDAPFLLTKDERYAGIKPFRTYEGYRYAGGYSDHLPVLLRIRRVE